MAEEEEFIYRISTEQEWEEFQKNGSSYGAEIDKSTCYYHLSKLDQVQLTLKNFFVDVKEDLYLLQVDPKKLGDGLIYEAVDEVNSFPHFYGPDKTFVPLPLDSVVKAEKLTFINGNFTCSFLT
ncbi:unnamed protein product [Arabidopsis thaliana]|uniref:Dihydroorotate dehydrogenase n=1 Tax=Arabidopsis thaliana TaxID=3702 RepID=A0A654FL09_ARATH|nr:unnamed protein product [Arabidopsis thaliana]